MLIALILLFYIGFYYRVSQILTPTETFLTKSDRKPYSSHSEPTILVLSLFMNCEIRLARYFRLLTSLDYNKELITLGILEGDSKNDECNKYIVSNITYWKDYYHEILYVRKNIREDTNNDAVKMAYRHDRILQYERRRGIAILRNYLLDSTFINEYDDFVLWLDSDLYNYTSGVLKDMLAVDKDIVTAHCVLPDDMRDYDLNTWKYNEIFIKYLNELNDTDYLVVQGYGIGGSYVNSIMDVKNKDKKYAVEIDSVGGTMLLVKNKVHNDNIRFPEVMYKHWIETEGFGILAHDRGYKMYALPNVYVYHK